jgi:tetratricopeptide (TPR) repeat protein
MNIKRTLLTLIATLMIPAAASLGQKTEASETFKKAEKYFYQKKFEMAELLLQEELKANPENLTAYSYLGDIFLKKERYDEALGLYQKALDMDENNAENYFRIGQIYYYKKLGNLAIENFSKAIELDKSMKFAYYHIGLSYLMLERDKENTIKNWETYLTIAPEDPQYEKIRRVIELLKDPNFVIPPKGSDVSIEEALLLGGSTLKKVDREAETKQAGNENKKTKTKLEGLYLDDEL